MCPRLILAVVRMVAGVLCCTTYPSRFHRTKDAPSLESIKLLVLFDVEIVTHNTLERKICRINFYKNIVLKLY